MELGKVTGVESEGKERLVEVLVLSRRLLKKEGVLGS